MCSQNCFHFGTCIGDTSVLNVGRYSIDHFYVWIIFKYCIGNNAADLNGRECIEYKHNDATFATNAVDHISCGVSRHFVTIACYIRDQKGVSARVHSENWHAGLFRRLQTSRNLGRVYVNDDRVNFLISSVFNSANDRCDVAFRVNDIHRPAICLCLFLEGFDIVLCAGLRKIGGYDGNLCRRQCRT